jgi:hypothetical protein
MHEREIRKAKQKAAMLGVGDPEDRGQETEDSKVTGGKAAANITAFCHLPFVL